ncbi:hypothetical protein NDK25_04970 [Niallia taxi]|nr:hypothetical protein [Niallia taxi]MDE5051765.1 hypothetical protein [Niallia taxi]
MTVRSPYINNLLSNISQLNNNLSYYLFVMEEFEGKSAELIENQPELYLKELYSDNKRSKDLNIKGSDFSTQSIKYKNDLYKSIFVNLYSHLDYYFNSLLSLVRKILDVNGEEKIHFKKEKELSTLEIIIKLLNLSTNNTKDLNTLWKTYDYIRYRRNCLMHNAEGPIKELNTIIEKQGKNLCEYWELKLAKKKKNEVEYTANEEDEIKYNFFENKISDFSTNEMIAMFNIFRKLAEIWDNIIISILEKSYKKGFLIYCFKELEKKTKKENRVGLRTVSFEKKIKGFTFQLFRYKIIKDDIETIYCHMKI